MTKVDLTTWKSHPLGGNLFAIELEIIVKIWEEMLMKHGTCLYLNSSIHTIGFIYLQPWMCLKKEELAWLRMRVAQIAQ